MRPAPRNCWHLACCKCGKYRPRAAGYFAIYRGFRRFICNECRPAREAA